MPIYNKYAYHIARFYEQLVKKSNGCAVPEKEQLLEDLFRCYCAPNGEKAVLYDGSPTYTSKEAVAQALDQKDPRLVVCTNWQHQKKGLTSKSDVSVPTAADLKACVFNDEFSPNGFTNIESAEHFASTGKKLVITPLRIGPQGTSARQEGDEDTAGVPDSQQPASQSTDTDIDLDELMADSAPLMQASAAAAATPSTPKVSSVIAQQAQEVAALEQSASYAEMHALMKKDFHDMYQNRLSSKERELKSAKALAASYEKRAAEAVLHGQSQQNLVRNLQQQLDKLEKAQARTGKRTHDGAAKASTSLRAWTMPMSVNPLAEHTYCVATFNFLPKEHAGAGNKTAMAINVDHNDSAAEQLEAAKATICEGPHCLLQEHDDTAATFLGSVVAARMNQYKAVEPPPRSTANAAKKATAKAPTGLSREYLRIGVVLKVNDAIAAQAHMRAVGERVKRNAGTRMCMHYVIHRDTDTTAVEASDEAAWQSILANKFADLRFT